MAKNKEQTEETTAAPEFSKVQLLTSNRYGHRRDLLEALLEDGKLYTFSAVDALIQKYDEQEAR